jgi:alkylation response protein AidB-like acyl-CoA dehydrogenase
MRVPADALLGGVEGQGFVQMMRELPRERLIIGVQAVHGAKGALDATVRYVQERQAFGWPRCCGGSVGDQPGSVVRGAIFVCDVEAIFAGFGAQILWF